MSRAMEYIFQNHGSKANKVNHHWKMSISILDPPLREE
jgi:hypothetical protein